VTGDRTDMIIKFFSEFIQNFKLRHKLSLVYTFIIIIPIIIVGEFSYSKSEVYMMNEAVSSLQKELLQVTEDINYKLDLCKKESDFISNSRQFKKILSTDFKGDMQKLNEVYIDFIMPTFSNLRFMLTDIKMFANNNSLIFDHKNIFSIDDIKGNTPYESLLEKKNTIIWLPVSTLARSTNVNYTYYNINSSDAINGKLNNKSTTYEKVLTLSRSLLDHNNNLLGIIDVYLPVSMLDKVLSNIKLPQDGAGLYLDSKGQLITAFGSAVISSNQIAAVLQAQETFGTIKQKEKILVFRKTSANNGIVMVSYPRSYINQSIGVIRDITQWTIILSILSVLFISFLLANLITKRLYRLMHKIKLIRDTGKMDVSITIPGNDEIAHIDRMFDVMMSRINDLTEKQFKAEITKKAMEMEILREQINPHFLYNSLSSIKWALNNQKKKDLNGVIDSLVRFYRLTLNKGKEILTVEDELQLIREYVTIQKFTYDADYEVIWDVNENVYGYYCIKLILQPFVENAILHGLNQKRDAGWLKIGAYLEKNSIFFVIEDNGQGFDTDCLLKDEHSGMQSVYKGFGIHNGISRIKLTYGEKYGVDIKSIVSAGTKVTVEIPAVTLDELDNKLKLIL
jgi:two-component system, sensor histidine kinase YesM